MGLGGSNSGVIRYNGMQIQSSLLGLGLSIGWGRAKLGCNLMDYVGFNSQNTSSGKGLGGSSGYEYYATMLCGICEGPINGVRDIYKDGTRYTSTDGTGQTPLQQLKISLALGTLTQAPWSYLTSVYPTHAIGYSSIAYIYAENYDMGSSATMPSHEFEIDFAIQYPGSANGDANPNDIIQDCFANQSYGVSNWPQMGALSAAHWTDYSNHCLAMNLLMSPTIDGASSTTWADFMSQIMEETNCEMFSSEGLLKVKPYTDVAVTGNGITWTPNLTPIYDITEDDLIDDTEVEQDIKNQMNAFNYWQVSYLDRSNEYQAAIATAYDLDNIINFGMRKGPQDSYNHYCDPAIAQVVTQFRLQRNLYDRDDYVFKLPEDFILLDPMDYITVTTTLDGLLLNRQLMLIKEIEEDSDNILTITAEAVTHTAAPAIYTSYSAQGTTSRANAAPGSVNVPVLFNAPPGLLTVDGQVWLAAAGLSEDWGGYQVWVSADGVTYSYLGTHFGASRYGVTTSALPLVADPDNTSTVGLDLSASLGTLQSVTAAEMNSGATLSLVGTEVIGYEVATLTSLNHYNIGTLRRGLYGSTIAAHASGSPFTRLDDTLFKINYKSLNVGNTLHVKLPSFNLYGRQIEDLSTVASYSVTLSTLPGILATTVAPGSVTTSGLAANSVTNSTSISPSSTFTGNATYQTIATLTLTPTSGCHVDISADMSQVYSSTIKDWGLRIAVNGTVVKEYPYGTGRTAASNILTISVVGVALAATSNTITLLWEAADSTVSVSNIEMSAILRYA